MHLERTLLHVVVVVGVVVVVVVALVAVEAWLCVTIGMVLVSCIYLVPRSCVCVKPLSDNILFSSTETSGTDFVWIP